MVFGVVVSAAPDIAYAAGSELSYDKTNVMDDLTSSTVNGQPDRKSTRLNSSHTSKSRMPSSA